MNKQPKFAFFGTPHLAAVFLDELEKSGLTPSLVVTTPDRKQGRGLELTAPPVKKWAVERNVDVLQIETWDESAIEELRSASAKKDIDVFVVIYYGKILSKTILDIPKRGTLNIHFSLLPRWRGTSPVRAAILNDDREVGTSIILLDEKIDHGPVVAQKKVAVEEWPPSAIDLESKMTYESAQLLVNILPSWVQGDIEAREQNHDLATQCPTLEKDDGLISLKDDAYKNLLKIRAFDTTIGTHAFFERDGKRVRVKILDAYLANGALQIEAVKPEGKREMKYEEFLRSGVRPL